YTVETFFSTAFIALDGFIVLEALKVTGGSMPKKRKKGLENSKGASRTTRRDVLKMGAVAGAATVLTSRKSLRSVYAQGVASVPPEPTVCDPNKFHNSPRTNPFMQQLPIPPLLQQTALSPAPTKQANIAGGEAPRADHQRWNEFLP